MANWQTELFKVIKPDFEEQGNSIAKTKMATENKASGYEPKLALGLLTIRKVYRIDYRMRYSTGNLETSVPLSYRTATSPRVVSRKTGFVTLFCDLKPLPFCRVYLNASTNQSFLVLAVSGEFAYLVSEKNQEFPQNNLN